MVPKKIKNHDDPLGTSTVKLDSRKSQIAKFSESRPDHATKIRLKTHQVLKYSRAKIILHNDTLYHTKLAE